MKNIICIIIFGLLIVSCTTNKYLPKKYKTGEVEYFDIEEFERIKNKKYNEYYLNKKDTIEIDLFRNSDGEYLDLRTVYSSNYILRKKFYPSGIIKERGKKNYPGDDFKIGIWEYFDESGNLLKTEDMDKRYKVSYKQALRKVLRYYCFSKKDLMIEIMPGNDRLFWVFSKNGKSKAVDMKTGKVYNANVSQSGRVSRVRDEMEDYIEESRKKKNTDSKPDSTDTN
ncbi:hypothetical protein HW49_03545 [Porphyromonadaceae bacterium COT-184 OH4590]|nr:hypothetical protein HW49_03545 [Porphyromonadaceae bacterium COT-184 OH4590]